MKNSAVLIEKSKESTKTAQLLYEHKYYNACVHSAYYSCLQLMKYVWLEKLNKTEEEAHKQRAMTLNVINKLQKYL